MDREGEQAWMEGCDGQGEAGFERCVVRVFSLCMDYGCCWYGERRYSGMSDVDLIDLVIQQKVAT